MPNRIEDLAVVARRTRWQSATDDLVRRVANEAPVGDSWPGRGPIEKIEDLTPTGAEVRSGQALLPAGREFFGSFPGGEVACLAEAGSALGSWLLRGTLWLTASGDLSARLDLIDDDHVLSSVVVRSGEPFRIEEIAGGRWHLELQLADGHTYSLHPTIS